MNKQIIEKKEEATKIKEVLERKSNLFSNFRLLAFLLMIPFIVFAIIFKVFLIPGIVIASLLLITFIVLVILHAKNNKLLKKQKGYLSIIQEYEDRTNDNWKSFTSKGTEYKDLNPDLFSDLDIVGDNSLFQLISVAKSIGGKEKLANEFNKLSFNYNELLYTQKAILELTNNFNFNIEYQELLNEYKHVDKVDFKEIANKLKSNNKSSIISFVIDILLSVASVVTLILNTINICPTSIFITIFLVNIFYSYVLVALNHEDFEPISQCSRKLGNLKNLYNLVANTEFKEARNNDLKDSIKKGTLVINKLNKLANLDSLRSNFISNVIINGIFPLNSIIIFSYRKNIKEEDVKNVFESIEAIEEFEKLLSLTTIGLVKENSVVPTYKNETTISFSGIKHPMLAEDKCISNDFASNDDINIITGSNMSGKSSFMKTVALNLLLSYTGSNVNANEFTFTFMRMFTSIKVSDDINKNISTFYGELLRIKSMLDYSKEISYPMIVFIDEIFKGTNYNDRIFGAKEIIKLLSKLNSIVFISTHDFELCEINNKAIHNYHFEEKYNGNEISFDYKLKDGQCKTTNAKFLMKSIGLIEN